MEYSTIWCIEHEYRKQNGCRMAEKLIYHYIVLQSSGKCFELKKKCLYKLILCLLTSFDMLLLFPEVYYHKDFH